MSLTFEGVIFDLGNTLIYFDGVWSEVLARADAACRQALSAGGVDLPTQAFQERLRARLDDYHVRRDEDHREHTTFSVLQNTLAEFGYSQPSEALLRQALRAMYRVSQMHWRLEPDALSTLAALRSAGYRLALISNAADDEDVQRLVDKAGLRSYFSLILTSAGEGIRKPKREIFMKALDSMGLLPERAVMVGDTLEADILGAKNTGMRSVWITRRVENPQAQTEAHAIHPDAVIHTLAELPPLLACWGQQLHDGQ